MLITVSLLNQDFTHWSDRDFIITSEKSLLVIFRPSLVRSDDTMTHLQSPLVPGTHSIPWHSAADDQYSGPFDMLPVVVEDCGHPLGAHFAPVQFFRHDDVNTSELGGYGFQCNSAVLGNEFINQLDEVIGNAV